MKIDEQPPSLSFVLKAISASGMRTLGVNHLTLCGLLVLMASCVSLTAQNVVLTGAVSGRITDRSEAAIRGAKVAVRNLETGVEQSASTDRDGLYRFPVVKPGNYSLVAGAKGFKDAQVLVRVLVGNTTSQSIKLQVGAGVDTVQVNGTGPMLRPEESSATTVLERSLTEQLPLNGRKYTDFVTLTPNTSYDGDTGLVSIAGQQGGEDSGYANGNGFTASPSTEPTRPATTSAIFSAAIVFPTSTAKTAIQEFQVAVSPYSALYGGRGGSSTRSLVRAATSFMAAGSTTTGTPRPEPTTRSPKPTAIPNRKMRCSNSAEESGGPIRRNRLWFFVDYEQQLREQSYSRSSIRRIANGRTWQRFLPDNFGIPAGTPLPPPNAPYPLPSAVSAPDATNPVYLQQVSNALNALNSNLGNQPRTANDWVFTPRMDLPGHFAGQLVPHIQYELVQLARRHYHGESGGNLRDANAGECECA